MLQETFYGKFGNEVDELTLRGFRKLEVGSEVFSKKQPRNFGQRTC